MWEIPVRTLVGLDFMLDKTTHREILRYHRRFHTLVVLNVQLLVRQQSFTRAGPCKDAPGLYIFLFKHRFAWWVRLLLQRGFEASVGGGDSYAGSNLGPATGNTDCRHGLFQSLRGDR